MAEITGDTLIGEVFSIKKGADEVIQKYMGKGCFTCPAITTEPLSMASSIHGIDLDALLGELNALEDGVTEISLGPPERKGSFLSNLLKKDP
ncbi:MAG: DUF1858 domain-containing protein [Candidatus Krumholzibacteria bacterium]|jgi:hypothetical protein|nr:DUF1858 domain-containing protein [Candidatus Krumholzibacteria bacterium]MDP6797551.1 DUF1858 domain-containing protein [Candidatus Krumholzibacteria bacterium]MDP7021304.1 DUF1858 domain-containing protein [Candidatus Krumholzibacteria bacterium]